MLPHALSMRVDRNKESVSKIHEMCVCFFFNLLGVNRDFDGARTTSHGHGRKWEKIGWRLAIDATEWMLFEIEHGYIRCENVNGSESVGHTHRKSLCALISEEKLKQISAWMPGAIYGENEFHEKSQFTRFRFRCDDAAKTALAR